MSARQESCVDIQSFQSMFTRYLGGKISSNDIKKLEAKHVDQIFRDPYVALAANNHIDTIGFLTTRIKHMEKMILLKTKMRKPFQVLTSTHTREHTRSTQGTSKHTRDVHKFINKYPL